MVTKVRTRALYHASVRKRQWTIYDPIGVSSEYNISGYQRTESEGHLWPLPSGFSGSSGGPFLTQRRYLRSFKFPSYSARTNVYRAESSGMLPASGLVDGSFVSLSPLATLQGKGTTAIKQTRPTAPVAGLGVAIGELKDGLPSLMGSNLMKLKGDRSAAKSAAKRGSDEFLNWEFGWAPLISDVKKSCKAVIRSQKIIDQLVRDSGRPVRRRFGFPMEGTTTSSEVRNQYGYPTTYTQLYDSLGTLYRDDITRRSVWFSGQFRYSLPLGDSRYDKMRSWSMKAQRLLQLRLDPELLWELAPWSWLADWFATLGDVVANLSSYAFDGLVLDYGYVMEHYEKITRYDLRGLRLAGYGPVWPRATAVNEYKRRIEATPFGFGLSLDSLSLRQWAILAALGISRGHLETR